MGNNNDDPVSSPMPDYKKLNERAERYGVFLEEWEAAHGSFKLDELGVISSAFDEREARREDTEILSEESKTPSL